MLLAIVLAIIEYFAISIFITIDPYAPKSSKRLRRFARMLLWLITDVVVFYLTRVNDDLIVLWLISCFFTIKYFLEMCNPYLGDMYFFTVFAVGVSYFVWSCWYAAHPIIVCSVILILACTAIATWKEDISCMIQRMDADIEEDIKMKESEKKKKRRKATSKFIWLMIKAWRI